MKKPIKSRYKTESGYKRALKKYNDFVKSNKTQTKSKTTTKQPAKRKPFDPPKRGRGRPRKQQPTTNQASKTNQTLKIAGDGVKKTGNFLKNQGTKLLKTSKKQVGKLQTKLSAKDQTPQQANPEPKTKVQKLMSRLNKSYQNYKGEVLDKAGKDLSKKGKLRSGLSDKSLKAQSRGGTRASLAAGALTAGTNALVNRAFKPKNMTMAEFKAAKEKSNREGVQKFKSRIKKTAGNLVNKVRGKSNQSSTTKPNKPNKTNNTGLKIKKTQYSSKNARKKQDFGAATGTKKADKRFGTFREDSTANRKLQLERQNTKGKTETYSRRLSSQAKSQTEETKANKKKKTKKQSGFIKTSKGTLARRGSVTARRAENREAARKRAQEMARRRLANR